MCASVFLDVQQAFEKVWHEGLSYKLKSKLLDQQYLVLKPYLGERYFLLGDNIDTINKIKTNKP
jgi:hypothetical protein